MRRKNEKYLLLNVALFLIFSGILFLYVKDRRYYITEEFVWSERLEEYIKDLTSNTIGNKTFGATIPIGNDAMLWVRINGKYIDISNRIPKYTRYGAPYSLAVYFTDRQNYVFGMYRVCSISIYREDDGQLLFRDDTENNLNILEIKRSRYSQNSVPWSLYIEKFYLPHVNLRVEIELKSSNGDLHEKVLLYFKAKTRTESSSDFIDRIMSI